MKNNWWVADRESRSDFILKSLATPPVICWSPPLFITAFLQLYFLSFWLLRRFRLPSILVICAANLFFYAAWGWIYLLLMPVAGAIDFLLGRNIAASQSPGVRRLLVSL